MRMGRLLVFVLALMLGGTESISPQRAAPAQDCTKRNQDRQVQCVEHPTWICWDSNAEEPFQHDRCDLEDVGC